MLIFGNVAVLFLLHKHRCTWGGKSILAHFVEDDNPSPSCSDCNVAQADFLSQARWDAKKGTHDGVRVQKHLEHMSDKDSGGQ